MDPALALASAEFLKDRFLDKDTGRWVRHLTVLAQCARPHSPNPRGPVSSDCLLQALGEAYD